MLRTGSVMSSRNRISEGVYQVGGASLSDTRDCLVYLVDLGDLVLVDCGAGPGWPRIADNIRALGFEPADLHTLILTHAHIDHIGAAAAVKRDSGCRIAAHELDREPIETGDPIRTAADWYGVALEPVAVDCAVDGKSRNLDFGGGVMTLIHTPGHTPGSLVAVVEPDDGNRVLFGQDIHGPFSDQFGSDLAAWRSSMRDLIALEADILCEGHFGVYRGKESVREFIEQHLSLNS
jgi:glyoxylase-like metal-dependent hydrolase (beta-lactamase superfamily II)